MKRLVIILCQATGPKTKLGRARSCEKKIGQHPDADERHPGRDGTTPSKSAWPTLSEKGRPRLVRALRNALMASNTGSPAMRVAWQATNVNSESDLLDPSRLEQRPQVGRINCVAQEREAAVGIDVEDFLVHKPVVQRVASPRH